MQRFSRHWLFLTSRKGCIADIAQNTFLVTVVCFLDKRTLLTIGVRFVVIIQFNAIELTCYLNIAIIDRT